MTDDNADERRPLLLEGERPKQRKPTPLPKLQIAIIMALQVAEPITSHCIYPFINQLISEFGITGGDEKKVGYYAGLIESIFFATEALFVFQWSRLSDHIGRKPVLLIGFAGMSVSMVCFGLSRTFWGLVASRSLVGALNGNVGVMKSMIGELTDETNIAQAFAFIPAAWATGTTIGPIMGGQLSKPHNRWPSVFSHSFWIKFPYFLPCAAAAAYSVFSFTITALFMKERHRPSSASFGQEPGTDAQDDAPPSLRSIFTRPVLLSIANYGALAFSDIAFFALVPLFLATPIALGGLGLSPSTIGIILGTLGLTNGVLQALFLSKAIDSWGPKGVFQVGLAMFPLMYALFPIINLYAKAHGITTVVWALVSLQMLLLVISEMAFCASFMFVTSSASDSRCLGAVNGAAQVIASLSRAIGPAASTSLERNWLDGYAVYPILVTITITMSLVSTQLPRNMWPKKEGSRVSSE
ncbi:MFS general substrate transporter [Daedaleopsis nitida]|nr:MFS general substrate transporter [Daedaleopsis nitida]